MNLHSIVRDYVGAVNPNLTASVQKSNGYTTDGEGVRVPAYFPAVEKRVQVQPLSSRELTQISGLNISGDKIGIYIDGKLEDVDRLNQYGGDLITLPDGTIWMVVCPLEAWDRTAGWTKVAAVKQVPGTE